jgi:hypothetical protein
MVMVLIKIESSSIHGCCDAEMNSCDDVCFSSVSTFLQKINIVHGQKGLFPGQDVAGVFVDFPQFSAGEPFSGGGRILVQVSLF